MMSVMRAIWADVAVMLLPLVQDVAWSFTTTRMRVFALALAGGAVAHISVFDGGLQAIVVKRSLDIPWLQGEVNRILNGGE